MEEIISDVTYEYETYYIGNRAVEVLVNTIDNRKERFQQKLLQAELHFLEEMQ